MCCACGVTLLMLPWIKVISLASPARVRASGAQPEMARFGTPEVYGVMPEMTRAELDFNEIQQEMWESFWIKVMMHVPRRGNASSAALDDVDERLLEEYKMLILKTSPWAIPRRSRFRSCPDLPRFSQFELCGGHLRRSASDGCLEDWHSAKLWHLVDVYSPIVCSSDWDRVKYQQGLMEQMCGTMPPAYQQVLARGLLDPPRLPAVGQQLMPFIHMTNRAAEDIGLPWYVMCLPGLNQCYCDIGVQTNGAALSQGDPRADLPYGCTPAHLAAYRVFDEQVRDTGTL